MSADAARALRLALWAGPLPDPEAPAAAAMAEVTRGDYESAMAVLRQIAPTALPAQAVIAAALSRWDWSIDAALMACDAGHAGALDALRERVEGQGRRRAAFAWAAWGRGQGGRALDCLSRIDPSSGTALEDRTVQAEFLLMSGDWEGAARLRATLARDLPQARHLRLEWQARAWMEGASVLASLTPPEGADAEFHRMLYHHHMAERDFTRARAALEALCAKGAGDEAFMRAEFALECEDAGTALDLICAHLPMGQPWDWPVRGHHLWLRARLAQALKAENPALGLIRAHLNAALRLQARHPALVAMARLLREIDGDWTGLEAELDAQTPETPAEGIAQARALARLGALEKARARLAATPRPDMPDAVTRRAMTEADLALQAGDLAAAGRALSTLPQGAAMGTRAELALVQAELALWRADAGAAAATLSPALACLPDRLTLWLTEARIRYHRGNAAGGLQALAEFHRLKTAQLGAAPPSDLRDLILADAAAAPGAARIAAPRLEDALAGLSRDEVAASPGLAAQLLFRWQAEGARATGAGAPVPRRIWHYWEGPMNGAVSRSIARWAALHEGFAQSVLTPDTAAQWMTTKAPALWPLYARQTLPAGRADVLRAALLALEGGIWCDLDEYPRAPVTPWLDAGGAVFVLESGHATVANNFIAAPAGHAVMTALNARLAAAAAPVQPYPWWDTGPAALTAELAAAWFLDGGAGITLLRQAEYCARVATNLPFPHKRGPRHWRR